MTKKQGSMELSYDAASIAKIAIKVKAEGFVPTGVLREEFGDEKTTQAIAILYRDFRLFREARRPWNGGTATGYEWSDQRFSKSEAKKVPQELGFLLELATKPYAKYTDFEPALVRCRWTAQILGSVPVKDENDDPINEFEKDAQGRVLILRYQQRAMASSALPMIGKEAAQARRIGWSIIRIPKETVAQGLHIVEHGIVEYGRPGGKGLRRSECLPDGIEFEFDALVPTSHLKLSEFLQLLRVAGKHVGLSPGRSAGFGDFEVLEAE